MQIEIEPPFRVTKAPDGAYHATSSQIQITATTDLGDVSVNHRCGKQPFTGKASRWLHVELPDKGVHLYVSGTHVVVSARDYRPTFDLRSADEIAADCVRHLRIAKDEKGRYVQHEDNVRMIRVAMEMAAQVERNRVASAVAHATARVASGESAG